MEYRWATSSKELVEEGLVGEHGLGLAVRLVAHHAVDVSMCVVESRGFFFNIFTARIPNCKKKELACIVGGK